MSILQRINGPGDLKMLSTAELNTLAEEIRERLIEVVSQNGGHLASNLGVVELTIALHRIFTTPKDAIVWDVGHQSYTHKMLTGRRDRIDTIRTEGGLSGFPKPYESEHDAFVAGHASTSISAAMGLAEAKRQRGDDGYVIAVIGDGAFTGGMAYEGLNNAGKARGNLIIILNDNDMSISKSVGSVANYLSEIRTKPAYFRFKDSVSHLLERTPMVGRQIKDALVSSKSKLKTAIYHNTFFEDLGFDYLGPIDGHDIDMLCGALMRAKRISRPVLIHIATQKGKGYQKAEENPGAYHGVSSFDIEKGNPDISNEDSFSTAFGRALVGQAIKDPSICGITAAMKYGTGLQFFKHKYPNRFYDVGIAEEHAVTFASGLATGGLRPVFAVYSTFLQRCYDQIIHDVALQHAHLVLAIDRAGLVGQDGETHQGIYDVSMLQSVPTMTLYSPATYRELRHCLNACLYGEEGPCALRYPRGKEDERLAFLDDLPCEDHHLFPGKKKGGKVVLTYGRIFAEVYPAAQKVGAAVLKLTKLFPLGEDVCELLCSYKAVYFVEEGIRSGGVSERLASRLAESGYRGRIHIRAIEDGVIPQASVESTLAHLGMDEAGIARFLEQE